MSHLRSSSKLLLVLRLHLLFSSSSSLTSSVLRDVICPLVTSSFSLQWSPWKRFAPSCLFRNLSVWSLESLVLSRLLFTSISSVEMMKGIPDLCLKYDHTGWSLKTVDCNVFLTDPKISKSAITQWYLESLYREVLVFWCFKIVRCVNFASRSFSNKEHLLHHSRP